jgi:Methyltransferase small domain
LVTTAATGGGPLTFDDAAALDQLRAVLEAAEFSVDRLEDVLGTHELSSRPADTLVHLRRLEGGDRFAMLARLFVLGAPVGVATATEALAPLEADRLAHLGVVRVEGDEVWPVVRLVPHGDYYVASDLHRESALDTPFDYVPGIQAPSVTLAKLAVRRPVAAALDLGTGSGIQALLAAKHSGRVVASDVNRRALNFAAFNARLNRVDNVDFRLGGAFEPVNGSRFDLIVSNPPYVISPDASLAYRDSGLPADELCRRIVADAPRFLADGGFAHILVSWVHEGDAWSAPLRDWVSGSGCDAWLLHFGSQDPLSHAAHWLRPLADGDVDAYKAALDRWLAYLRSAEIEAIGYGAVVLRRREPGPHWVRADELGLERLESAGEHTLRLFAAQDCVEALRDDGDLLGARFSLADSHRLEQTLAYHGGAYSVETRTLRGEGGFGFRVGVDRYTASLLPHFDGETRLEDVLARAATQVELGPGERERFIPAALPVVRRLLGLGFLVRADQ